MERKGKEIDGFLWRTRFAGTVTFAAFDPAPYPGLGRSSLNAKTTKGGSKIDGSMTLFLQALMSVKRLIALARSDFGLPSAEQAEPRRAHPTQPTAPCPNSSRSPAEHLRGRLSRSRRGGRLFPLD